MNAKVKAVLVPALHTLWQSFAGLIIVWYSTSGAQLWHSVDDVASAKRFALAALAAAGAALLSALYHTVVTLPKLATKELPTQLPAVQALEPATPAQIAQLNAAENPAPIAIPETPIAPLDIPE